MTTNNVFLILLIATNIISVIYILLNKKIEYVSLEICDKILNDIILRYFVENIVSKVNSLRKAHDLNSDSKTNAIQTYLSKRQELLRNSTKDIINILSPSIRKSLIYYYGLDGLILLITSKLNSHMDEIGG